MTKKECLEQLERTKSHYRKRDLEKCLKRIMKEEKRRKRNANITNKKELVRPNS